MENYNDSADLNNLNAGRDFADYLIANGYSVTTLFVNPKSPTQWATFDNGRIKIDYLITDKESSFEVSTVIPRMSGWHKKDYVSGPDLEADVLKFSFLCHAMGWVKLEDANLICKNSTGESLFMKIKKQFNSQFEAKQEMNEVFATV